VTQGSHGGLEKTHDSDVGLLQVFFFFFFFKIKEFLFLFFIRYIFVIGD
jgi:hypothetical protein